MTDHRVGVTEHGIDAVLSGERLDMFVDALSRLHRQHLLEQLK